MPKLTDGKNTHAYNLVIGTGMQNMYHPVIPVYPDERPLFGPGLDKRGCEDCVYIANSSMQLGIMTCVVQLC